MLFATLLFFFNVRQSSGKKIDLSLLQLYSPLCIGDRCGGQTVTLSSSNSSVRPLSIFIQPYTCPAPGVPQHWTSCCDPPSHNCCRVPGKEPSNLFEIDQTAGIFVAAGVIIVCVVTAVVLILCCCWERCPLYLICRTEAKPDYIATGDEVVYSAMPTENEEDLKLYAPNQRTTVA
ncbi:hypothetical protein TTRE_0000136501 [Trichuris trichiura]|uniref:Uncharacterized protein n=1 Tax=Trichuris trichiura TaxID=36087 RepID=A0A077YYD7_TRITR|nr:hypothetical protein TTRE_0000136501 [Trichuris trichiura]